MKMTELAWMVLCLLVDAQQTIFDLYQLESWRDQEPWLKAAHFFGQLAGKTRHRWGLRAATPDETV